MPRKTPKGWVAEEPLVAPYEALGRLTSAEPALIFVFFVAILRDSTAKGPTFSRHPTLGPGRTHRHARSPFVFFVMPLLNPRRFA